MAGEQTATAQTPVSLPAPTIVAEVAKNEVLQGPQQTPKDAVRQLTIARWGSSEWPAMEDLVQKESGWNMYIYNRLSGACGLFQSLPCSKVLSQAGRLGNFVGQAQWGVNYIAGRYGTPAKALYFWKYIAPTYDLDHDGRPDGKNWY